MTIDIDSIINNTIYLSSGKFFQYKSPIWSEVNEAELRSMIFNTDKTILSSKTNDISKHIELIKLSKFTHPQYLPDHLICLKDCFLDLEKMETVPLSSKYFTRTYLDYSEAGIVDENSQPHRFLEFLNNIFSTDDDKCQKIMLIQEFMGACLKRDAKRLGKMIWFIGNGSNGKSVLTDVIKAVIGRHNCSSIELHDFGGSRPFNTAQIDGKLLNVSSEVNPRKKLNESTLKALITGDSVQVENKNERAYSLDNTAKFLACMNDLPPLTDLSDGFIRRIKIVEFNVTVQKDKRDVNLLEKLLAEQAAIFRWALEGLGRLVENGDYTDVPSSNQAIEKFLLFNDPIATFLKEYTDDSEPIVIEKAHIYDLYRNYCHDNGIRVTTSSVFGKHAKKFGVKPTHSDSDSQYIIRLKRKYKDRFTYKLLED
ncbi:hypothetical protein KSF73_01335 [Burkholderiaceae bacterium DAT-1]|nr:hypothetical protein [Burkholderiaceae bacterium DAT-1]